MLLFYFSFNFTSYYYLIHNVTPFVYKSILIISHFKIEFDFIKCFVQIENSFQDQVVIHEKLKAFVQREIHDNVITIQQRHS
jgi:hypothetical protein